MIMSMLCVLQEFIRVYIFLNPNFTDKRIYLIAKYATYFCVWLCIDELFNSQVKHLQVDIDLNPPSRYLCHLITLFFRKFNKIDSKGQTYQVFSLDEDKIRGYMKIVLDK